MLAAALPGGLPGALEPQPSTTPNMLPWRRHDLRLLPFTRSPEELWTPASGRCARERIDLRGGDRRLERHRRGVAGGRAGRGRAPARRPSCSSTPRSSRRTARSTWPRRHRPPRAVGPQALRAVRRGRARRRPGLARTTGRRCCSGGGAIELVTLDDVVWADAPERHEAGSPNVMGAVALGGGLPAACAELGMETVAAHERALAARLWDAGSPTSAGCARSRCGRPGASTGSASRPSRSRATGIPAGRDPQRRARDRRPPRLLLRPPADRAAARLSARRDRRAPDARAARGPAARAPRRRAGEPGARDARGRTSTAWPARSRTSPAAAPRAGTASWRRSTSTGRPTRRRRRPAAGAPPRRRASGAAARRPRRSRRRPSATAEASRRAG